MTYQCFYIEPIWSEPNPRWADEHYYTWGQVDCTIEGWRRIDTGEVKKHLSDFGVGAMWHTWWYPKNFTWDNETEPHLIVRCPDPDASSTHDWDIDSRCSNCGSPDDRSHRCWVRHGLPPLITVNKNGLTCKAGAGSIQLPLWHGFLENGILRPC